MPAPFDPRLTCVRDAINHGAGVPEEDELLDADAEALLLATLAEVLDDDTADDGPEPELVAFVWPALAEADEDEVMACDEELELWAPEDEALPDDNICDMLELGRLLDGSAPELDTDANASTARDTHRPF